MWVASPRSRSGFAALVELPLVASCGGRTQLELGSPQSADGGFDDGLPENDSSADVASLPESDPSLDEGVKTASCLLYSTSTRSGPGPSGTWVWNDAAWTPQAQTLPTPPQCLPDLCGYVGTMVNIAGQIVFIGIPNASDAISIDTWTWAGTAWVQQSTSAAPPPRWGAAVAVLGSTVVLFGGSYETVLSDTWVLSGTTWTQESPSTSPPARAQAAVASIGNKVLLFGGADDSGSLGDTWLWDGVTWAPSATPKGPGPRSGASAATVGDRVLLFGGCSSGGYDGCGEVGTSVADTWEWDPIASWTLIHPATSPPARNGAVAAGYRSGVLLFGGVAGPADAVALSDTWIWDGATWAAQEDAGTPTLGTAAMGCE